MDNHSHAIDSKDYEKFHPGQVELTSRAQPWQGLLFTRYSHPLHCSGAPRPATQDHLLAFANNGAVKGQYQFNGGRWRPYVWRQHEWLLGQAFENSRDSRWDSMCSDQTELSVCYLHLSPKLLERHAMEATQLDPNHIELPHKMSFEDPLLLQLGLQIKQEAENTSPYGRMFVETAAALLSVYLLKNYASQSISVREYQKGMQLKHLTQVLDYIHNALDKELSLHTLAKMVNMSTYHFARTFKATLGLAPHQYIMKVRIQRAKELLQQTTLPVGVVALEVGYSNSHFIQIFKRQVGCSPSHYRSQLQN